jgi:ribosomal protein L37AE/L43A
MARTSFALSEDDLERELLRKSVGALAADRHPCADCGRTPLTGERVHRYPRGIVVCELCRQLRKTEPDRTELVRHSEHGHTVLRVTRVAA